MQRYFCKVTRALGRNQAAGTRALARALPGSDRQFWSNSDPGEFNDDQDHQTRHRDCTYKSDGSCNFQPSIGRVSSWWFGGSQSRGADCSSKGKVPAPHTTRTTPLGIIDLTTPTMGPWGKSLSRHPGINYPGNNRRSAAIRTDFAEKDYTDRRATFFGQCGHCPLPAAGCLGVQPEAAGRLLCDAPRNSYLNAAPISAGDTSSISDFPDHRIPTVPVGF